MCMSGECCGLQRNTPARIDPDYLDLLRDRTKAARGDLLDANLFKQSILKSETLTALEFSTLASGSNSLVIVFQKLGIFGGLDVRITEYEFAFPMLKAAIWVKFEPFDKNSTFSLDILMKLSCADIRHPAACRVDIDATNTSDENKALIDWDCLKKCAPLCISCGEGLYCWLACAGACVISCL